MSVGGDNLGGLSGAVESGEVVSETNPADILILDFQPPDREGKMVLPIATIGGVCLWQTELTNPGDEEEDTDVRLV